MRNISVRTKLMFILLFVSLLSSLVLGIFGSREGKKSILKEVTNRLRTERIAKKSQIEDYLSTIGNFVEILGQDPTVHQATNEFKTAFDSLRNKELTTEDSKALADYYVEFVDKLSTHLDVKKDIDLYYPKSREGSYLQYEYIVDNPNPLGEKNKMLNAGDESDYSKVHSKYHSYFNRMMEKFNFHDVFLVDLDTGDIVYSAYKETDFATNLYSGSYRNSNLATLVRQLKANNDISSANWMDFASFRPSYGSPAGFVGVSLIDDLGGSTGALIFEIPVDEINKIMTGNESWAENGLGDSGETYLVGEDQYMRSISRFYLQDTSGYTQALPASGEQPENINRTYRGTTILQRRINTEAAKEALKGNTDTRIIQDYRNVNVLSSYAPLDLDGLNWAILAEIDEDEVMIPVKKFDKYIFITAIALMVFVTILALFLSGLFIKPINNLMKAAQKTVDGDTKHRVAVKSKDEFGRLGGSFNAMVAELDQRKAAMQQESEFHTDLLQNFVPSDFTERLKNGEKAFAKEYEDVTLILIDVAGFSELLSTLGTDQSVLILSDIMEAFDVAALDNHVERIRSIGDSYFAACGLFEPRLDHTIKAIDFAKQAQQQIAQINLKHGTKLDCQISLTNGDVIAGIIGNDRFSYDLWGDVVGQIFQMNRLDADGEIMITRNVQERIIEFYQFEKFEETIKSGDSVYTLKDKN